ncbi:MAG: glycerophosphodiester phosphodiesterase [Candidatus Heimdallarchaeota archaeon]
MLVIAHRGASGWAPENTIPAFQKAVELGADMIEFDIQFSADRHIVVFHDKTVDRTTNGTGRISEKTLADLRQLDAGAWFDPHYAGTRIPTLREALSTVSGSVQLNIELKYFDPENDLFEQDVAAIATEFDLLSRAIFAARHPENIRRLKELLPGIKCVLLQKERTEDEYVEALRDLDLTIAQIRRRSMNQAFIDRLHDHQIKVNLFYADEPDEMKEFIDMGIDGILTNYPDRLCQVIRELAQPG